MQKVYVMTHGNVENGWVLAVFSSSKKAKEAKEWLIKVDTHYNANPNDLNISTFELNGERL